VRRLAVAALALAIAVHAEDETVAARIALYVGIDEYHADPSIHSLRGCVNDVTRLASIMDKSFGFREFRVLKNAEATRAGIRDAFWWLMDRTEAAHRAGTKDIVVLFAYAGHGGLVKSRNHDETNDTTIVPSDGFKRYKNHIRDDDVNRVLGRLQEDFGATVVYIRDACHAGTSFRRALFAGYRSVLDGGEAPAEDPEESIFDGSDGRPTLPNRPNARLVYLGATADAFVAEEGADADGRPCGKFSWSLARTLARVRPGTTYGELSRRTLEQFRKDWPDSTQLPQSTISPSLRDVSCFGNRITRLHAEILERHGSDVTLSMGSLHGVTEGSVFRFYGDQTDLEEQVGEIATATVTAVQDITCTAHLESDLPDRRTPPVARLDAVQFRDFRVSLLNDLSAPYMRVLERLHIPVTADDRPYAVALLEKEGIVRVYLPERLPGDGTGGALFEASSPDILEDVLSRFACARRLLALERNEGALRVSLRPAHGHEDCELPPENGERRFRAGAPLDVVIENPLPHAVHVFAFYDERSLRDPEKGEFALFWPQGPGYVYRIEPKATLVLTPPDREYFRWETSFEGGARFTVKLLFTEQPYDPAAFAHLAQRTGVRAGMDDLQRYLARIGQGGATHRDATAAAQGWWSTASIVFTVQGP
jgi:hypothetical protein